jgi:hypothetical protein
MRVSFNTVTQTHPGAAETLCDVLGANIQQVITNTRLVDVTRDHRLIVTCLDLLGPGRYTLEWCKNTKRRLLVLD